MTAPVLIAGSTSLAWTGGISGNVSDQLVGFETSLHPIIDAIQALDTSQNPAIVIMVSVLSTGQGSSVGATLTVGGYSAEVVAECLVGDIGGAIFSNVLLAVLPVTSSMTFTDATTIATIPGMAGGGSPFIYGARMVLALYYNVDPTANAGWAAGFTAAQNHAGVTSLSVAATADQLAVASWSNTVQSGGSPYVINDPVSDFTTSGGTALAGFSVGLGIVGSTGTFNATATFAGGHPDAAAIVGLLIGAIPTTVTVPDVVGLDDASAQSAIIAALLTVGTTTHIPGPTPNQVVSQSPLAGTVVSTGSAVDLVEYEGLLIPDVVNTSATLIAPGIITGAGFVVGTITYAADVLTIPGNVVSQSPAAGTFAAGGTPINIVVSTGRAGLLVPLILFLTEAEAIDALTSIGLVPGAISFASSTTFAAGEVMFQSPSAGNPVAYGSIVGLVVSLGTPIVSDLFDTTPTVISQYANSPTLLQWISNMNLYLDQSVNFAKFLAYVWNVNTAIGFGLNILGRIVNVSRLLQIPNTTLYVGFDNGTRTPSDWEPLGSNLPGGGGIGALYSGHNATQAYLLDDDAYRQLILAKAFANICSTTAPSINRILQNLYGDNNAWVLNTGVMSISYNFRFRPSPIQLAILQQSGVIPTPPGVSVTIVSP